MTSEKITKHMQELQLFEQQIHGFLMQKQALQMELNESLNALNELEKTKDEVYKILSGVMMKSDKASLIKDLTEKKKKIEMRIEAISKQEKIIENKAKETREELDKLMKKKE